MKDTKPKLATAQWGQFLRNHDELDLGRLEEQQRQTVFAAFGPEPEMQHRSEAEAAKGRSAQAKRGRSLSLFFPAGLLGLVLLLLTPKGFFCER